MQVLTPALVASIFQVPLARATAVFDELILTMRDFSITTPQAITCYFTQTDMESGGMQFFTELGDQAYFMKYDINGPDPSLAQQLGNLRPGDGFEYRGSGALQLTGYSNFVAAQAAMRSYGLLGPDGGLLDITTLPNRYVGGVCMAGPDLVRTDRYAFAPSAWWWQNAGGNQVALRIPIAYASLCCGRMVNEGDPDSSSPAQGEADRVAAFNRIVAFGALVLPPLTPAPAPKPPVPPIPVLTLLEEIMASSDAEKAAFAQQVADAIMQTKGMTNGIDPKTGKEGIIERTFHDVTFGGASTTAYRTAQAINWIKNKVAGLK
jgi:predicted chitinase